jgi:hypothetical protein
MIPGLPNLKNYAVIGAVVGSGLLGAVGAWTVQSWRYEAKELERVQREQKVAEGLRKTANKAAGGHEQDKVRINTEFVTIEKEVERVVNQIEYRDRACLDADSLELLNRAIRLTESVD